MAATICGTAHDYVMTLAATLRRADCAAIERFADMLFEAWRQHRRVFVFGNGGSATTATHHAADFMKTAAVDGQRRLEAVSLVDNNGITTAIGNDIGYDEIFRYQLGTYARPRDVAVAISASGNSPNVLRACEWARENHMPVVAITGFTGGRLKDLADVHVHAASDNYGIVEDFQLAVGHIAAQLLKVRVQAHAEAPSLVLAETRAQ